MKIKDKLEVFTVNIRRLLLAIIALWAFTGIYQGYMEAHHKEASHVIN